MCIHPLIQFESRSTPSVVNVLNYSVSAARTSASGAARSPLAFDLDLTYVGALKTKNATQGDERQPRLVLSVGVLILKVCKQVCVASNQCAREPARSRLLWRRLSQASGLDELGALVRKRSIVISRRLRDSRGSLSCRIAVQTGSRLRYCALAEILRQE